MLPARFVISEVTAATVRLLSIVGYIECIRLLMDYGASPVSRMTGGWTPAHCAAEAGRITVLRALHNLHASIMKRDKYGDTPKMVARVYGHYECVRYLEQ